MGTFGAVSRLDSFIEKRAKYRNLRPQFAIALLAGLAFALDPGALYYAFWGTDAREFYGPLIAMLMVSYTLAPVVLWWGVSAVFFLIARSLGAHLSFGILFRVNGWGMIPLAGSCLSLGVGRFLALQRTTEPCSYPGIICDPGEYSSFSERVGVLFSYLSQATFEPVFVVFYAIGAALFLVAAYFWIVALGSVSNLTRAGAAIVVGVPSLLLLAAFTVSVF